jgi:tetratricopeptide (TPR) repeat protein/transcriptional regulator with XRE-family HTH domain
LTAPSSEAPLSELLKYWRARALLTQEELAERSGVSVRTICRIERGAPGNPRSGSMRLLAEALDLDEKEQALLAAAARRSPTAAVEEQPSAVSGSMAAGPTAWPRADGVTVPRQLPADVIAFVGRERELSVLAGDDDRPSLLLSAVNGMAGIGKTALALHAAHRLAPLFPDGQLFIDLHGYTPGMSPVEPADALDRLLHTLGVPGEQIPRHPEDRAALYRSVLSTRNVLIVLDNASSETQVQPLLPGHSGCRVLITSRRRLSGLDDVRTVSLDVLPVRDAIALFTRTAGRERIAGTSRNMLAEAAERCGLLPLAIRIAASRLRSHSTWDVAHLLDRLSAHDRRLSELAAGRRSIAAALDLSYRELTDEQRRAYRLLGLHPGRTVAADAVAALLNIRPMPAARLLDHLLEANLLKEVAPDRYHLHDLVRDHAVHAAGEEPEPERQAALTRLLDHLSQTATAAIDLLHPHEIDRITPAEAPPPAQRDPRHAADLLDAELANLLAAARHAADHGGPARALHLSATLHPFLRIQARRTEAEALHAKAPAVGRATGNRAGELHALLGLGDILRVQGGHRQASHDLSAAPEITRATGRRTGELPALAGPGVVHGMQARYQQATDDISQALKIARDTGNHAGELSALTFLAWVYRMRGRHEQAADHYADALELARELGNRMGELKPLSGLGHIHLARGEHEEAATYFTRVLELASATGSRTAELRSLRGLAEIQRLQGRHAQAVGTYRQVLQLAQEMGIGFRAVQRQCSALDHVGEQ